MMENEDKTTKALQLMADLFNQDDFGLLILRWEEAHNNYAFRLTKKQHRVINHTVRKNMDEMASNKFKDLETVTTENFEKIKTIMLEWFQDDAQYYNNSSTVLASEGKLGLKKG